MLRRYDADGMLQMEYPMISNYWFPSLPVFPQGAGHSGVENVAEERPEISIRLENGKVVAGSGHTIEVYRLDGTQIPNRNLAKGVYIVKTGIAIHKIRI